MSDPGYRILSLDDLDRFVRSVMDDLVS